MGNFNKVILMGNLTRDVELRNSQGGMAIAKFGMAINRKWGDKDGEKKESTCFVDLTAFGKQAELIAQHVSKGHLLFVEGRLDFQSWEDKDGEKRSKLAVIVENFQFMHRDGDAKKQAESKPTTKWKGRDIPAQGEMDPDQVPF